MLINGLDQHVIDITMPKIPKPKSKITHFSIELDPPEQFRLGAEDDLDNDTLL